MLSRILLKPIVVPTARRTTITRKYNSITDYIRKHPYVSWTAYGSICASVFNTSVNTHNHIIIPIIIVAIGVDDITPEHDNKFRYKRYALLSLIIAIYIIMIYIGMPLLFEYIDTYM